MFCHGCGKQIHALAPYCPNCGAPQRGAQQAEMSTTAQWASITSLVTAIISSLVVIDLPDGRWDHDTIAGAIMFGVITGGFGIVSLIKKQRGQWMAIIGVCVGVLVILVALGSS